MPGEKSWPTQPFPTVVPPFSKLTFTEDDINPFNNITPEEREAFREKVRGTKNLGMFTPIDFIDTMHLPGSNGGSVFGTAASEPGTGMVYVIGQNNPGILRLMRTGEPRNRFGGAATPGEVVYQRDCASCHGPNRAGTDSAPSLAGVAARLDNAALRATMIGGKGRMPAFPHLTEVEMADGAGLPAHAGTRRSARPRRRCPRRCIRLGRSSASAALARARPPAAAGGSGTPGGDTVSGRRDRLAAVHHQRVRHHRQADEAAIHDDHQVRPQHPGDHLAGGLRRRPGAGREGDDGHRHAADAQRRGGDRHGPLLRGRRRQQGARLRHANGTVLWTGHYSGTYRGTPIMYAIDGRQYCWCRPPATSCPRATRWRPMASRPGRSGTSPSHCRNRCACDGTLPARADRAWTTRPSDLLGVDHDRVRLWLRR